MIILGLFRRPCSGPLWSVTLLTGRQVYGAKGSRSPPPGPLLKPSPLQPVSKAVWASAPTVSMGTPGLRMAKQWVCKGVAAAKEGGGRGPAVHIPTLGRRRPVWAPQCGHHSGEKWADPGGVRDMKSLGVSETHGREMG